MKENILENGYGRVPKVVISDDNISITAKAIYSLLCVFKGKDNVANPKKDTIQKYLGIGSKNTLNKYLKQLEDNGYIEVTQCMNVNENGSNIFATNNYLLFDKIVRGDKTVDVWSNGFSIVPRKVVQDKEVSLCAKVVYTFLAGYKTESYPSTTMIKEVVGLSNNKLSRTLNELEATGYILRENIRKDGKFATNTYRLIGYDARTDEMLTERLKDKNNSKKMLINDITVESAEVKKDVVSSERKVINKRQAVISEKQTFNKNFTRAEKVLRKNLRVDTLKEQLEGSNSNDLKEQYRFFETSINLILETIFSGEKEVLIAGKKVKVELLEELFFNLDYEMLNDVYNNISLQNGFIKNMKSYTLSSIYNAIMTYTPLKKA